MALLRIKLRADLCVGSGESAGVTVDTDLCMDDCGLPYIPARRLKGCLRQTAERLSGFGSAVASPENIRALFGDSLGQTGCLRLRDALLPGSAELRAWLRDSGKLPENLRLEALPLNVAELFTYVRGQTRLQDGVGMDNTLRYTRVLDRYDPLEPGKETVLEAVVDLPEREELRALLEQCCKATRHIGTHRNRGLGSVRMELCQIQTRPAPVKKPPLPARGETEITYTLSLEAPLTLPGCGELCREIPARSVIGCAAEAYLRRGKSEDGAFRQLFLDGTAPWSCCGARTFPLAGVRAPSMPPAPCAAFRPRPGIRARGGWRQARAFLWCWNPTWRCAGTGAMSRTTRPCGPPSPRLWGWKTASPRPPPEKKTIWTTARSAFWGATSSSGSFKSSRFPQ